MEQALDTLAASRKLEDSDMPERQADAVVEVVNDAMKNLVTKEYLTAELDRRFGVVDKQFGAVDKRFVAIDKQFGALDRRFATIDKQFADVDKRFTKLEAKMEVGFASMRADMHSSQKLLLGIMMASTLAVIAMQIMVLAILL